MRKYAVSLPGMSKRQKQHRHGVRVCRSDAGVCVFRARTVLHCEDAGRPAIRHARVTVSDADAHTLLTADYRANARVRRRLDDRGGRKGAQVLYVFFLQNLGYGVNCSHLLVLNALCGCLQWV